MSRTISRLIGSLCMSLSLVGAGLSGCGGGDMGVVSSDVINPTAVGYDRTAQPLTGFGGVSVVPKVIKGTYGPHCKLHAGQAWDLTLNDPSDKSVEIAMNDTFANCPLTLTTVRVQSGVQFVDYLLASPITLGVDYANNAVAVNRQNPPAVAFYTNARLNGLLGPTYSSNFVINLLYSDDALACGAVAPPAIYSTVTATSTATPIPPPNYTVGFDGLQLMVDANKIVQSTSTGNVVLKQPAMGGQVGEEWRLFDETNWCCQLYSFAEIDTVFRNVTPLATGTISGTGNITIPWTSFDLLGRSLPRTRTVIVKHTGNGGVYSYELVQILFPGPPV